MDQPLDRPILLGPGQLRRGWTIFALAFRTLTGPPDRSKRKLKGCIFYRDERVNIWKSSGRLRQDTDVLLLND